MAWLTVVLLLFCWDEHAYSWPSLLAAQYCPACDWDVETTRLLTTPSSTAAAAAAAAAAPTMTTYSYSFILQLLFTFYRVMHYA